MKMFNVYNEEEKLVANDAKTIAELLEELGYRVEENEDD
jgi:sulfur carrier protein ThiS